MQINPYSIPSFISAILILGFGILIYSKDRRSRLNMVTLIWTLAIFVWLTGYSLSFSTKNEFRAEIYIKIAAIAVAFLTSIAYDFVITFLGFTKERKFVYLFYTVNLILIHLFLFTNYLLSGVNKYFFGYYGKASYLYPYYLIYTNLIFVRVIYLLFKTVVNKNLAPKKETQTKYILLGYLIAGIGSIDYIPKFGIEFYPCGYIFLLIWILIISYAILKHQLMDINIVIKKGLVYSILVAIITIIYLIFVLLSERFLQGLVGYRSLVTSVLTALIIALLFNPLRNRIQRFLDKRFFRGTLESLVEERERLKQELFQTEKLAYVGGLASSIAHEIKNPLTVLKTFIEYLPTKANEPEFKEKIEKFLPQEIERIENVVHQLLDLAKPRQPSFKQINIINTIDTTLSLLENNLKSKRIEVKEDYAASEIMIQGDEEQLRQVFLNLFLNSIQAMEDSGTLTISTSIEYQGSSIGQLLSICVKDNGCGINEENLKKLFTPFFTTKKEGVGLGLSITQEIIRQHKGRINVESEVGKGTRFVIELPIES